MTDHKPRTAAGRALADFPMHTAGIGSDRDDDRLLAAILAIEAEAAATAVDVVAAVRHFLTTHDAGVLVTDPLWCDGKCQPLRDLRARLTEAERG